MKKILGYILSITLYRTGDLISYPMLRFDWAYLYPIYNQLMIWSYEIQKWAGIQGPWQESVCE